MKKGFTLIELLAVIVILAIIALIATPIVLNIINDTKESATLRSADFYLDALELSIAQGVLESKNINDGIYPIMSNGNLCLGTLETNTCTGEILEVEVNGETPTSGEITITNGNIDDIYLEYKLNNVIKNGSGELINHKPICTYVDSEDDTGDAIGVIDISDIVTCGTENFYVMYNENNEITMLSMYNLDVGNYYTSDSSSSLTAISNPAGIQNEKAKAFLFKENTSSPDYLNMYGVIAYSTTDYWSASVSDYPAYTYGDYKDENGIQQNIIYPYVEEYEEYLKEKGVNSASASLMSYEQALKVGCNSDNCASAPSWVSSTSFWLGSSQDSYVYYIYRLPASSVASLTYSSYSYNTSRGIRPVVTISTREIK